jgi:hypothetical protein
MIIKKTNYIYLVLMVKLCKSMIWKDTVILNSSNNIIFSENL